MLEERDEGCCHGSHLVRGHVHVVDLLAGDNREVGFQTALDAVGLDGSVVVHADVGEGHILLLFLLGAHVFPALVGKVDLPGVDLAVRSLDETELVDAGIDAE